MKPGVEKKESSMEFPCQFPIKAMGKADDDFDVLIVSLVRKHASDVHEGAVNTRLSRRGNYVSVTITIEAQSQEQLDDIYQDLTAHERVIMAF